MKVWLITVGEPLPIDASGLRLLRAGMLAARLVKQGHEVIWWSSAFDHHLKLLRSPGYQEVAYQAGYQIHLLPGRPYSRNVSWQRIMNHREIALAFRAHASTQPRPDVILASFPTIELCLEATEYGLQHQTPVVLDVRDLWPDAFLDLVPQRLKPLVRLVLSRMYRETRQAFHKAAHVIGITEDFVDWALNKAGRPRSSRDRAFPLAYKADGVDPRYLQAEVGRLKVMGVKEGVFRVVFFGTLGRQFDIDTLIAAARLLRGKPVQFVICGSGDKLEYYKSITLDTENILLPGWVSGATIQALMQTAQAGIAPYVITQNFVSNVPNKIVEYLSGGLPVITCLTGEVPRLLETYNCGLVYESGSAEKLAQVIEKLMADEPTRKKMAVNARQAFEARFNADHVLDEMISYLQSLVKV